MNIGTHATHCCYLHGCKYGNPRSPRDLEEWHEGVCPVASGEVQQEYPCPSCPSPEDAAKAQEEALRLKQEVEWLAARGMKSPGREW